MKNSINIALIILVFFTGAFYYNQIILGTLTIIGITINLFSFFRDKNELRKAFYYVRPKRNRSLTKTIIILILLATLLVCLFILNDYIPQEIKDILDKGISLYFSALVISFYFSDYLINFKNSIRSFNYGIVIPKISKHIFWKSIKKIDVNKNTMVIDMHDSQKITFNIDERDFEDANNIKAQFEKNA